MLCLRWLLLAAPILAKPISPRAIDLDHNGVADYCTDNGDDTSTCLENGSWTRVSNAQSPSTTVSTKATQTGLITKHTPTTSSAPAIARLPQPDVFAKDNGTKWRIEYVGDVGYTGALASENVNGDKCRTSKLGGKIIWNCGDMMCGSNLGTCGFSMGPAFYGTDSVMTINTDNINNVNDNLFMQPWIGDARPQAPLSNWGMDTSNIAAINDTHGVAYAWEIWRGSENDPISDRGNAVAVVTLGADKPIAQRVSPLLTGPEAIQLGLVAILRDQNYIYIYSAGGPSKLIVTRVSASDDVFDPNKYEALQHGTTNWVPGIPKASDNQFGMTTSNDSGAFGCAVYGSVFYNNYLQKYTIICNVFMSYVNMYTSDTPYGPWSSEYGLLNGWHGYGSMVHPDYSPGGSHKELYFSLGPNTKFNMFKLTFDY